MMLPDALVPAQPKGRPAPIGSSPGGGSSGGNGGSSPQLLRRHESLRSLDRALLALCLLALLTLTARCLAVQSASSGATLIATATTVAGGGGTQLSITVVDNTAATQRSSASPRRRRASMHEAAAAGTQQARLTVSGDGIGSRSSSGGASSGISGASASSSSSVLGARKAGSGSSSVSGRRRAGRKGGKSVVLALQEDLPADFDAEAYLAYHPDLQALGVTTAADAAEHYVLRGRAEGRPYRRMRVLLRYTACTGLINQHYSHVAAFSLAAALGAELVLPPAVCRDSFAHYFSVFKEKNEVRWSPVPLDTLLDVDSIIDYWAPRGMVVHRTPALRPFPDLTQPESAFPRYPAGGLDPNLIVRLPGVYLKDMPLSQLMEAARAAVVGQATSILQDDPAADLPYIVLDLPCSFFALRALSALPVVTEVARSLAFAPKLHAMADRIYAAATLNGSLPLNGVHLRIEKDARDWASIMGGQQVVWRGYIDTMQQLGFNATTRLYVASGMLTYGASVEMARTKNYLRRTGVCEEVHHKEQYVARAELEALNSEQKALVDFLVLAKARRFVGFGSSTFSFYLREYRALQGIPREMSGLVDASIIGTDKLFHSAGTVV